MMRIFISIAAILLFPQFPALAQSKSINVIEFYYGCNLPSSRTNKNNFTVKMKEMCDGNAVCEFSCSNEQFVDTCPNVVKTCWARFGCGDVGVREESWVETDANLRMICQ